jgi:hypothetical protein
LSSKEKHRNANAAMKFFFFTPFRDNLFELQRY